jgi:colanic acid biosynthesis glycosyl transferase WcaI
MRLLILSQYFPPETGAAQVRLLALAREFRRLGHDVQVVTGMPNYPTGRIFPQYRGRLRLTERYHDMTLHRVWLWAAKGSGKGRILNFLSFTATALLPLPRVERPDVIFVESPPITMFLTGLAYRRRFPGALLVYNVADQWIEAMRDFGVISNLRILSALMRFVRSSYRRADLVTTVTHGIVDDLIREQGVPAEKVLLLPNGADPAIAGDEAAADKLLADLGLRERRLALCIGTHGYIHGMETLLEAAAELTDLPDVVVLLIGDGSEKGRLVELARARGLDNVRFADPVPPAAVLPLYRRAKVGLSTVRDLPISLAARPVRALNAMAAGVPVVYAGRGEGAELVRAAKAGIVTPPGDGSALAAAIRQLMADPAAARAMGESGKAYIARHLAWPAIAGKLEGELVRLLDGRRGGRPGSGRPAKLRSAGGSSRSG